MLNIKKFTCALFSVFMLTAAVQVVAANDNSAEEPVAYAILGDNVEKSGMNVSMGDIDTPETVYKDGFYSWVLDPANGTAQRYIYVDVDDDILYNLTDGTNVDVTVEYYDEGIGSLTLEYPYYEPKNLYTNPLTWNGKPETVNIAELSYCELTDTKTWKKHTWHLERPAMKNSLNGSDFRFGVYSDSMGYSLGNEKLIKSVSVSLPGTKHQIDLKISSDNLGNIFFTDDEMQFECTFDDTINPYYSKNNGQYTLDVTYTLVDSANRAVDQKTESVEMTGGIVKKTNVRFKPDKYDLYTIRVEARCDSLKLYTEKSAMCSYVRSTKGKIRNPRAGVSTAVITTDCVDDYTRLLVNAGFTYARVHHANSQTTQSAYDHTEANETAIRMSAYAWYQKLIDAGMKITGYSGPSSGGAATNSILSFEKDFAGMPYTDEGRKRFIDNDLNLLDIYGDSVSAWEICNEANLKTTPYTDDRQARNMALLQQETYKAIKEKYPNLPIGGPQQTMIGNEDGWIENFLAAGGANGMDFMSFHSYQWGGDPISIDMWTNQAYYKGTLNDYARLFKKYNVDKPLWVTEYGASAFYEACTSEWLQGCYDIQSTLMFQQDNLVDKWFIFRVANSMNNKRTEREGNFGMIRALSKDSVDRGAAKPKYLAFSNFNIEMTGTEYVAHFEPDENTRGYLYRRPETDTDIMLLFTNKTRNKLCFDLGTNEVTLTDLYGNKTKLTSKDGTYSFSVSEATIYIEGKFTKCELVDNSSVAPSTNHVSVLYNEPIKIDFSNSTGSELYIKASLLSDSSIVLEKETAPLSEGLNFTTGDYAPVGKEPINVQVYDKEGNIYYSGDIVLEYTLSVDINTVLSINNDKQWYIQTELKNNLSNIKTTGYLTILAPQKWADQIEKIYVELEPGETKSMIINIPESFKDDAGSNVVMALITDESTMRGVYVNKVFDFIYAPHAKSDIKIDGKLDEWSDGWMVVDRPDQFLASVGYDNLYGGKDDIWGKMAVMWDEDKFYFAAEVHDDIHYCQGIKPDKMWGQDDIQVGIVYDPENKMNKSQFEELSFGLLDGVPTMYRHKTTFSNLADPSQVEGLELQIVREGDITYYEMSVPWTSLIPSGDKVRPGMELKFAALINESDNGERKGMYRIGDGINSAKNSDQFLKLYMSE